MDGLSQVEIGAVPEEDGEDEGVGAEGAVEKQESVMRGQLSPSPLPAVEVQ